MKTNTVLLTGIALLSLLVTLDHGVGEDWMAIARKAWIAPYQTVAAYWRAAQVMDTVTAKASATGWIMNWVSPHPKMPRKVELRIQLDSAVFGAAPTVSQNGVGIAREADGSYVIDFMQKTLQVAKSSSTGIGGAKALLRARTRKGPKLSGVPLGTDPGLAKDIAGRIWRRL